MIKEHPDLYLSSFFEHLTTSGKKTATVQAYLGDVRQFLDYLIQHKISLDSLESQILGEYFQFQLQPQHANSIRRKVIALKLFFRFLQKQSNRFSAFEDLCIPVRLDRLPNLPEEKQILEFLQKAPLIQRPIGTAKIRSLRDQAVVALLALEGIKSSELVGLRPQDFVPQKKGATLFVRGPRQRLLQLSRLSKSLIQSYLKTLRAGLPEAKTPYLFVSFQGRHGAIFCPQMSRHGLKFLIYEVGEALGVEKLNAATLRHLAIRSALKGGEKKETLAKRLGLRQMGLIQKHMTALENEAR